MRRGPVPAPVMAGLRGARGARRRGAPSPAFGALLLVAAWVAGLAAGAGETPVPPSTGGSALTFEQAVGLALAANPSLAAARLRLPVATAGIGVARQRPNPDLVLETQKELPHDAITLSLPIETAGKRSRRIGVAEAGVKTGEAELAETVLSLRNELRRAYYGLCAAQRRADEAEELARLAQRARDAAKDRFESGAAPRLEALSAELGAEQADNEALAARADTISARAALNVLLARPPDQPTEAAGELGSGEVPSAEAAAGMALASSATLAVLDGRLLEESARLDLARAQRWPDVTVEGSATHDSPPEFEWGWRAALVVNVPLFHHRGAEVRVEESALAQLRAEREAVGSRIRGAAFAAAAVASAQRDQYLRYRDRVLPRADEVQRMAEDSYRSGQTGLVLMIQAFQAIRDLRRKAIQAGLDYQIAVAELERAIGVPLP
jgi:outer membrane protein, heavy metal efflux system